MGDFLYVPSPLRGRVREGVERFTFPLAPSLKGGRNYAVRHEHFEGWNYQRSVHVSKGDSPMARFDRLNTNGGC